MLHGFIAVLSAVLTWSPPAGQTPAPRIEYTIRIDTAHLDAVDVTIAFANAPPTFRLAMKVHAEYDARYWRYIDGFRVDGSTNDAVAGITREDSTLWSVALPGGRGSVHYRVHVQPPPAGQRRAWMPALRADGAFINPPDFFLYSPDFPSRASTVALDVPRGWRIATALAQRGTAMQFLAPDAETLLDSPIMLGALREWSFREAKSNFHVVYWPLPGAARFDTASLVDELHRLTHEAIEVFGSAPSREFYFLLQDGAGDALEHAASVAVGVSSAALAENPRASRFEMTHEFFHSWNLVAIRAVGYNDLSYRAPAHTPLLWLGEGVTLRYSDLLSRRASLVDSSSSRLDLLANLLQRYYGSSVIGRISPERASLAFDDPPSRNPDATGGYYLQGELLGDVLDARVREATAERRGLDDVMRALFEASRARAGRGFTSSDVEQVADRVCACRLDNFFSVEVRGPGPIDVTPVLSRIGLRLLLDTIPAADSAGRPLPDLRLSLDFSALPTLLRAANIDSHSIWALAGVRAGDELITLNGAQLHTYGDLQIALRALSIGESATLGIRRGGVPQTISLMVTGYTRPRVRFVDVENITPAQRARRREWMAGR